MGTGISRAFPTQVCLMTKTPATSMTWPVLKSTSCSDRVSSFWERPICDAPEEGIMYCHCQYQRCPTQNMAPDKVRTTQASFQPPTPATTSKPPPTPFTISKKIDSGEEH